MHRELIDLPARRLSIELASSAAEGEKGGSASLSLNDLCEVMKLYNKQENNRETN